MRPLFDRIRHTLLFEGGLLILLIPIGTLLLDSEAHTIGLLGVGLSLIAMACNGLFNYLFDRLMIKRLGHTQKTPQLRIVHALLFEATLLMLTLPLLAWALNLSLWQALLTDIGFAGLALVYAYLFNWGYDLLFPLKRAAAYAPSVEG